MSHKPMRKATRKKYLAIQQRYKILYEEKRIRRDDVIKQLCEEFFIMEPNTIWRILGTYINPDLDEDPNQLSLF